MEDILKCFNQMKERCPQWENVINKVIEGISDRGFDSSSLNDHIDVELDKIRSEYEKEFVQNIDNEA